PATRSDARSSPDGRITRRRQCTQRICRLPPHAWRIAACYHPAGHVMLAEILRRLVATIPVMMVVALAVFALLHVTPGDPAVIIAGDYATSDDIARIRARLGLDQPFTTQVGLWLGRVVRGDLGTSIFSGLPVSTLIGQRAATTAWLTLFAMLISVGVGVPVGVVAAWRRGSWVDRVVMMFAVSGFSMPTFWLG